MFLQHIADIGLLPHDPNSNVLAEWPPPLKRRICGDVLRSLGSSEGAAELLKNEAHVQWAMEVTGEALRLPLELAEDGDSLERAVDLYSAWLGSATSLPAVAGQVRPAFLRDVVRHCSLIFERRPIDHSQTLRRRYLEQCQHVTGALEALGRRGAGEAALGAETWRMLLRVVLGVADAALGEGHSGQQSLQLDGYTAQLVASQLLGELLRVVFVTFLSCPGFVHMGRLGEAGGGALDLEQDCWKLLRERSRRSLNGNASMVAPWTIVCQALSHHLTQVLGGDSKRDGHMTLRWKDGSESIVELRSADVVTSWYRVAVLLGRPAAIRNPAVRRAYLKNLALLSELWSKGAARRIGGSCWRSLVQPWLLEASCNEAPGFEAERILALTTLCDISSATEPCLDKDQVSVLCSCLEGALHRTPVTASQPHSDQEAIFHLLLLSGTALAAKTPRLTLHLIAHLVRVAFKVLLATGDVTLRGAATQVLQTLALLLCQPSGPSTALLNGEETATLVLQSLTREAWQTVPSGDAWNIRRFCWLSSTAALIHGGADVICDTAEQLSALAMPNASEGFDQAPGVVATAVDALALLSSALPKACAGERAKLVCGARLTGVLSKICASAQAQLSRPTAQSCMLATSVMHCALDCALAAPWLLQHTPFTRALLGLIRCARHLPSTEFSTRDPSPPEVPSWTSRPSTMESAPRSSLSQLVLPSSLLPPSPSPATPRPSFGGKNTAEYEILICTKNTAEYVWHVFSEHAGLVGEAASQGAGAGVTEAELLAGGTGNSRVRCFALQDPDAVGQVCGVASVLDTPGSVVLIFRRAAGKFVWRFRALSTPLASTESAAKAASSASAQAASTPSSMASTAPMAGTASSVAEAPRPRSRPTFSEVYRRASAELADGDRKEERTPSAEQAALVLSVSRVAEALALHGGKAEPATAPSRDPASDDDTPSADHALLQQLGALGGGARRWLPLRSGSVGLLNALRELDEAAPVRLHFQVGVLMASRWPSSKTLAQFEGFLQELGAPATRRALAGWKADIRQLPLLRLHAPDVTLLHSSYNAETLFVVPATMKSDSDFDEVLWLEHYAKKLSVVLFLATSDGGGASARESAERLAAEGRLLVLLVQLLPDGFYQIFCFPEQPTAPGLDTEQNVEGQRLVGPVLSGAVLPNAQVAARLVRLTALRALCGGGSGRRCDPLLVRQQRLAHIGRAFATGHSTAEVQASFAQRPV